MGLILLPSEIYHREFDAKLILAMRLVQEHNSMVLFGFDKHFNKISESMPPSLIMDKSCSSIIWQGRIKNIKLTGGNAVVNDEEGFNGISESTKNSIINRVDDEASRAINKYLCWGKIDLQFYSQVKHLGSKLTVLGNCRSDLLGKRGKDFYSEERQALQKIYGDFVLCSDNFGVEHRSGVYKPPQFNASSEVNKLAYLEFQNCIKELKRRRDIYAHTLEEAVVKLPHINFILRPHPRSDHRWWVDRFWKYRNLHVIYHLNIEPWIHSASALVSMGCTSAIQSIVAGTPVIEIIDKNPHLASAEINGYAAKFTNLYASSGAELIDALGCIKDEKLCFKSINTLNKYWYLCQESSANNRFSELMGGLIPYWDSDDLHNFQDFLNKYSSFYRNRAVNFDDTKWINPQFSAIIRKVNLVASSFQLKVPKIHKVCNGLYLMAP